ncbi:MAG: hypothetical protein ACI4J5_00260 [Oscillospiraceae bacterium]
MKRFSAILFAVICCIILASCGSSGGAEITDTAESSASEWNGDPPQNILNTDFRNIVWGMNDFEVFRQEQRMSDGSGEYCFYYDNVKFAGFDSRLYYYFDDTWKCYSAAYIISLSPDEPSYSSAYEKADSFLTELFVPPDEEGGNIRTTPSAVIELISEDSDTERTISVKFSMPEGYSDKKSYSKVIYFEDGEPVGSSVSQ